MDDIKENFHEGKTERFREKLMQNKLKKEWQLITKVLEVILVALSLGFVMEPAKRGELAKVHLDHFALIFTTFIGYILINTIFLIGRLRGDKMPYRTGFIFSLIASCLFFVSGILLAIDRKRKYFYDDIFYEPSAHLLNLLSASSVMSFLSSILFALESMYIWKFREDF